MSTPGDTPQNPIYIEDSPLPPNQNGFHNRILMHATAILITELAKIIPGAPLTIDTLRSDLDAALRIVSALRSSTGVDMDGVGFVVRAFQRKADAVIAGLGQGRDGDERDMEGLEGSREEADLDAARILIAMRGGGVVEY